ncbi:DUF4214 domain-containing protein [Aquihabitans sp. McL0605]|uniref:DUF4214 domain-containing protein n=1 Tax=Aquihabitans sp. McL0605 TaxID=3415671 RepID=UPI003CED1138
MGRNVRVLVMATMVVVGAIGVTVGRHEPRAEALAAYYDPATSQGSIYRLYRAYMLREPDQAGFTYWRSANLRGTTLAKISESFARSSEFTNRYGKLTNGAFIDRVYANVLGRPPDGTGRTYWLGRLDKGLARGTVMLSFSDSSEYKRATALGVPPGFRVGTNAQAMLAALTGGPEPVRTGYDRSLFKHWDDEDGDGCDTRCEVLQAEKAKSGMWFSLWDGSSTNDVSQLEIDHVVALAEAWDSGADGWTATSATASPTGPTTSWPCRRHRTNRRAIATPASGPRRGRRRTARSRSSPSTPSSTGACRSTKPSARPSPPG